jgi:hypothetical protein
LLGPILAAASGGKQGGYYGGEDAEDYHDDEEDYFARNAGEVEEESDYFGAGMRSNANERTHAPSPGIAKRDGGCGGGRGGGGGGGSGGGSGGGGGVLEFDFSSGGRGNNGGGANGGDDARIRKKQDEFLLRSQRRAEEAKVKAAKLAQAAFSPSSTPASSSPSPSLSSPGMSPRAVAHSPVDELAARLARGLEGTEKVPMKEAKKRSSRLYQGLPEVWLCCCLLLLRLFLLFLLRVVAELPCLFPPIIVAF